MTEFEPQKQLGVLAEDFFDPDDFGLRDSPPLRAMKVILTPSPSPSPSPPPSAPLRHIIPDSSPSSPVHKGSNPHRSRLRQGDWVLVSFMDGGKRPEIARHAGVQFLDSDGEEEEESSKTPAINLPKGGVDELTTLAANAMMKANVGHASQSTSQQEAPINKINTFESKAHAAGGKLMEDAKPAISSITATYVGEPSKQASLDTRVQVEVKTSEAELPPILLQSSHSNLSKCHGNIPKVTLPSISDQFGDIHYCTEPAAAHNSPFAQSPPERPSLPRFPAIPGQGSPPKSAYNLFRPELPSPGGLPYHSKPNGIQRLSQLDGRQYPSTDQYSTPTVNTETLSTDQSTPAIPIDRMSIDGITNPQTSGFQCTYPGCAAQPFRTQYLLNSHANVHLSNRPHYCSVSRCARSKGGKGFKRKNEMVRHGLVHKSPGYVCPFCLGREHKYPRPDNLLRHVRTNHVDKDKDDAQLREVLSKRLEGPNRGRRRRERTS